jgi:hypothetical protein
MYTCTYIHIYARTCVHTHILIYITYMHSIDPLFHHMAFGYEKSYNTIKTWLYRVSQEECAKLWESVPYVKVYRYNPKQLYLKMKGYGDNGQRKVGASCGSTYCTCSADRITCTLRMPVLESFIAANVATRQCVILVVFQVLLGSWKGGGIYVHTCHVKCLEPKGRLRR